MTTLVPIPWQPSYYLTPDTLALLTAAGARLGIHLLVSDAWRSYAEQKGYWDYYLADPKNHPVASNPDTGQRNHMRGAAFDLVRTDPAVQAACRAVGLNRDPDESWHWNNPAWRGMPIIPDLTSAASSSASPIPTGDEVDMANRAEIKADTEAVVKAAIAPLLNDEEAEKDATRREARPWRLFRNTDRTGQPDEFVAIAYLLPPADPRQVIRVDRGTADKLRDSYLMTADTPDNARPLNARDIETAVRMAAGTDRIYGS